MQELTAGQRQELKLGLPRHRSQTKKIYVLISEEPCEQL